MARRTQDTQRRDETACPDCSDLSRRDFLKTTAAVAAVGAAAVPLASMSANGESSTRFPMTV